jgi:hypothetical protein
MFKFILSLILLMIGLNLSAPHAVGQPHTGLATSGIAGGGVQSDAGAGGLPHLGVGGAGSAVLRGRLGERPVSFRISAPARFPAVVAAIAAETGLAVLADAFSDEPGFGDLAMENVPLDIAVTQLAGLFQREIHVVGDMLVLRHRLWSIRKGRSITMNPEVPWLTPATGRGELARDGEGLPRRVRAEVQEISAEFLARRLGTALNGPFAIDPELGFRRVTLVGRQLTAAEVGGGLEILFNAATTVRVRQTGENLEAEAALAGVVSDQRTPEQKLTDELRTVVERALSDEQRAALAAGDDVFVAPEQIPVAARGLAHRLAETRWEMILSNLPELGARGFDWSRGFSLRLLGRQRGVGIRGHLLDGEDVTF